MRRGKFHGVKAVWETCSGSWTHVKEADFYRSKVGMTRCQVCGRIAELTNTAMRGIQPLIVEHRRLSPEQPEGVWVQS